MSNTSDLYSLIRLHANNCPDITIDKAINRTAREFCELTWFCKRQVYVSPVSGQGRYQLVVTPSSLYATEEEQALADSEEIFAVKAAQLDGCPLYPISQERRRDREGETPSNFIFYPPSYIELYPRPNDDTDTDTPIVVSCVSRPKAGTTLLADELAITNNRALSSGALFWILSMPNEKWTNGELATMFRAEFYNLAYSAKSDQMFSFKPWNSSITNRSWAI